MNVSIPHHRPTGDLACSRVGHAPGPVHLAAQCMLGLAHSTLGYGVAEHYTLGPLWMLVLYWVLEHGCRFNPVLDVKEHEMVVLHWFSEGISPFSGCPCKA